jgi:hypothetical protein
MNVSLVSEERSQDTRSHDQPRCHLPQYLTGTYLECSPTALRVQVFGHLLGQEFRLLLLNKVRGLHTLSRLMLVLTHRTVNTAAQNGMHSLLHACRVQFQLADYIIAAVARSELARRRETRTARLTTPTPDEVLRAQVHADLGSREGADPDVLSTFNGRIQVCTRVLSLMT